jgi:pimeloyl-ACP methyl ester carboxylesterase
MRLLGETLSQAGFPTVRLSYHGTGESMGADEDPDRVAAWIASIHAAVDGLRRVRGVDGVGLVGLRLGATLAAAAAQEREIHSLILWEPCRSGAAYTREMEILAVATRKALTGDASSQSPDEGIDSAGYLISPRTIGELAGLDLAKLELAGTPQVLLLSRDDRPAPRGLVDPFEVQGCAIEHERLPGYKEMMVYPLKSRPPLAVLQRIREWAVERSEQAVDARVPGPGNHAEDAPRDEGGDLGLVDELVHGAVRHRVVRFGPDRRLFGVIAGPADSSGDRSMASGEDSDDGRPTAVLLLTGGIVPRTAVNRMYVGLARRLAADGRRVLRLDVSGIGESDPEPGGRPDDAYPRSLLDDTRAAAQLVTGGDARAALWVVGLCSGGYAAYQHALADPRVVGVTLINPIVYYPERGLSFANEFAGDDEGPAPPEAGLVTRLTGRLGREWDRLGKRLRRGRLARDLEALARRSVSVRFAFAKGDPGSAALREELGERAAALEAAGVRFATFDGADHTFNPLGPRAELLDWVVDGIEDGADPGLRPRYAPAEPPRS